MFDAGSMRLLILRLHGQVVCFEEWNDTSIKRQLLGSSHLGKIKQVLPWDPLSPYGSHGLWDKRPSSHAQFV